MTVLDNIISSLWNKHIHTYCNAIDLHRIQEEVEIFLVTSCYSRGMTRGMQIHQYMPFFSKSVDLPMFSFKSQTTDTRGNRS